MTSTTNGFLFGKSGSRYRHVAAYGALTLASLFALFPVAWAVATSFKLPNDVVSYPPKWIPDPATLENYKQVLGSHMPRYLINSFIVATVTAVIAVAIAAMGGYGVARFQFRGRNGLLLAILSTVMVPGIVILVPLYMIGSSLHLLNTYAILVVIFTAWQSPSIVWLMRGFFEDLPRELEEAALIDGCTRWKAFVRIVLPQAQPGLAAGAIFVLIYVWNEFIIALALTTSDERRLTPVGLYLYISAFGVRWGQLTAALTLSVAPILLLFVFLQKRLVQGLTSGALKG